MVKKYAVSFLLAVITAGGPAAGATAMAAAGTGTMLPVAAVETPPYPPQPHQKLESRNENSSSIKLKRNSRCRGNHCGRRGCGGVRGRCSHPHARGATGTTGVLPFTGAPLALVTVVGGGLLGVGIISTLISARRRRSSDAA